MANRAEKLRRRQHRKEKKRGHGKALVSGVARSGDILVVNPPGAGKMSEALLALIKPEWDG